MIILLWTYTQSACEYFSSWRKEHRPTGKKHIGKEKFLKESKLAEIQISQKFRLVNYNMEEEIQATESKR